MPLMLPCLIYGASVEAGSFKEVYVSPYNNQEYKRYECPNYDIHWWESVKFIPEFYESKVLKIMLCFTRLSEQSLAITKLLGVSKL
ncbi:MAG: hypothetical protein LM575_04555 [Caldimicrobium sp.]|nr:hypothetical protein [Caldimicrobium sp.]